MASRNSEDFCLLKVNYKSALKRNRIVHLNGTKKEHSGAEQNRAPHTLFLSIDKVLDVVINIFYYSSIKAEQNRALRPLVRPRMQ